MFHVDQVVHTALKRHGPAPRAQNSDDLPTRNAAPKRELQAADAHRIMRNKSHVAELLVVQRLIDAVGMEIVTNNGVSRANEIRVRLG